MKIVNLCWFLSIVFPLSSGKIWTERIANSEIEHALGAYNLSSLHALSNRDGLFLLWLCLISAHAPRHEVIDQSLASV